MLKLGGGRSAGMREQTRAEDEHPGAKSERSFEASEAGARSGIPRWSGNAGIRELNLKLGVPDLLTLIIVSSLPPAIF